MVAGKCTCITGVIGRPYWVVLKTVVALNRPGAAITCRPG